MVWCSAWVWALCVMARATCSEPGPGGSGMELSKVQQAQGDVDGTLIIGTLDGKIYALNAWTGMWCSPGSVAHDTH